MSAVICNHSKKCTVYLCKHNIPHRRIGLCIAVECKCDSSECHGKIVKCKPVTSEDYQRWHRRYENVGYRVEV